jgi:hypothetical protein
MMDCQSRQIIMAGRNSYCNLQSTFNSNDTEVLERYDLTILDDPNKVYFDQGVGFVSVEFR